MVLVSESVTLRGKEAEENLQQMLQNLYWTLLKKFLNNNSFWKPTFVDKGDIENHSGNQFGEAEKFAGMI